jgi:hypothetical protein
MSEAVSQGLCGQRCIYDNYYESCNDLFRVMLNGEGNGNRVLSGQAMGMSIHQDNVLRLARTEGQRGGCAGPSETGASEQMASNEEKVLIDCPLLADAIERQRRVLTQACQSLLA